MESRSARAGGVGVSANGGVILGGPRRTDGSSSCDALNEPAEPAGGPAQDLHFSLHRIHGRTCSQSDSRPL